MDNSETLTTLGTQETGRTIIDITLHRKKHLQFRRSILTSLSNDIFHVFSPVLSCPLQCSVRSSLLPLEEIGVSGENHQSTASH
jgi:hypothetical protein